jgi:hypothetical protein
MRRLRADLEYGWQAGASEHDVGRALDVVGRILHHGALELGAHRPSVRQRLVDPK